MIISKESFNKHWSETVHVVAYCLRDYEKKFVPLTMETIQGVIDREVKQRRWLTRDVPHQFHTWLYEFGMRHPEEAEQVKKRIGDIALAHMRPGTSSLTVPAIGLTAAAGGVGALILGKMIAGSILTSAGVAAVAIGVLEIPKRNAQIIKEVKKYLFAEGQEMEKIIEKFE